MKIMISLFKINTGSVKTPLLNKKQMSNLEKTVKKVMALESVKTQKEMSAKVGRPNPPHYFDGMRKGTIKFNTVKRTCEELNCDVTITHKPSGLTFKIS